MNDAATRDGYMKDAQGRLVPVNLVKDVDKVRDTLVREIAGKALALRETMRVFRDDAMGDMATFVELSAEQYGAKVGGNKGNLTLTSYDGQYKIQRSIAETLVFDERLQAAKELIDECITEWTEGSRDELKALINDDDRWRRAMQAVSDSLQVAGTKAYIRIYVRREDGKYEPISLDLAAL